MRSFASREIVLIISMMAMKSVDIDAWMHRIDSIDYRSFPWAARSKTYGTAVRIDNR